MIASSHHFHRVSPVIAINGVFLLIIGFSQWGIATLDWLMGWRNAMPFVVGGLIANMLGGIAVASHAPEQGDAMDRRQVLFAMVTAWVMTCIGAVIPFMLGSPNLPFDRALFEAVSAVTTTGATVITGLDGMPKSILLWRSLLHWYGGMGIIIGAMVLFPAMRIGGMQFFLRAGFETTDKILPSARAIGLTTFYAYGLLTVLCMTGYILAGMSFFDAVNLAMSTLATGGLAVSDSSFGNYSDAAEYVSIVFMMLAGFPLLVFIHITRGNFRALAVDRQIPIFLAVFALIVVMITAYRLLSSQGELEPIVRNAMFNGASLLTGTGFTNGDIQVWGSFPMMVLLMAMLVGGCTGSTSGAIKIFRYQVLIELVRMRIRQLQYPNGVFNANYGGRKLDDRVIESVAAFFMIYLMSLAVLTVLFSIAKLDILTAFSAAVSAVGNVGPGMGNVIGSVGNYASFEGLALWTYMIAMIVGRLEFMFFFVLVLPRFWRH